MQVHLLHRLPVNAGLHLGQAPEDADGFLLDVPWQTAVMQESFDFGQVPPMLVFTHDHIQFGCSEAVLADFIRPSN